MLPGGCNSLVVKSARCRLACSSAALHGVGSNGKVTAYETDCSCFLQSFASSPDSCSLELTPSSMRMWQKPTSCMPK